jgi:hypothetical protein
LALSDRPTGDKKTEWELSEIRVRRDSPTVGARDAFLDLKNQLCRQLLSRRDPALDLTNRTQIRPFVHDSLDGLLDERGIVLNRGEKRQLLEAIVAELSGSPS